MDNLALLKQSDVLAKTVDWMVSTIDILNHYLIKKKATAFQIFDWIFKSLITIHSEISVLMLDLNGPEWTLFVCLVEIKD